MPKRRQVRRHIFVNAAQRAELDPGLFCQLVILLGRQFAAASREQDQSATSQAVAASQPDTGKASV